jgi:hypothetical protein
MEDSESLIEMSSEEESSETIKNSRVSAYFDGFNLFHSLTAFGKKYYWLDYKLLTKEFMEF